VIMTPGGGCYADSVYNAERITHASITAWESRANCSSRPWVLMRTLCQRSVSGNHIAVVRPPHNQRMIHYCCLSIVADSSA
jgi:hypothetical protein